MHDILESLGFNVRILVARVLNDKDVDVPRTHRITLLEFENKKYIVDVGFGAICPREPISLNNRDNTNQDYKIIKKSKGDYHLALLTKKGYFTLYEFNLQNYTDADCIMGNFYSSQHPKAVFVNNFVVSLVLSDLILSIRNNKYHRIYKNKTEIIKIQSYMQLSSILKDDFNIPITKEDSHSIFNLISKN